VCRAGISAVLQQCDSAGSARSGRAFRSHRREDRVLIDGMKWTPISTTARHRALTASSDPKL